MAAWLANNFEERHLHCNILVQSSQKIVRLWNQNVSNHLLVQPQQFQSIFVQAISFSPDVIWWYHYTDKSGKKQLNAQSLLSKGGCLLKEIKNVYNRGRGGIFMRLSFSYRWAYSTWFHALLISGVNGGGVTWKHSENLSTPLCFIEVSWTATYSILTLRQELYFFQLVEQLEKHEGMGHPHQWYNENPPYYISLQYGGSYLYMFLNIMPTSNRKPCGNHSPFSANMDKSALFCCSPVWANAGIYCFWDT